MSFNRTRASDGPTKEFHAVNDVRIHGDGTFGGGTIVLQEKQIDGTWQDVVAASYTEEFDDVFACGVEPATLRFNLSGSTAPTINLSARGEITFNG